MPDTTQPLDGSGWEIDGKHFVTRTTAMRMLRVSMNRVKQLTIYGKLDELHVGPAALVSVESIVRRNEERREAKLVAERRTAAKAAAEVETSQTAEITAVLDAWS